MTISRLAGIGALSFVLAAHGAEASPELEPSEDPALIADLEEARERALAGSANDALDRYAQVVARDPSLIGPEDIWLLVEMLGSKERISREAANALTMIGVRAVHPLLEIVADEDAARLHRARAAEVLIILGRRVDLVPLWIDTLGARRCSLRRIAIRRVSSLADPRAIPPLRLLARADTCGSREAALAIGRLDEIARTSPTTRHAALE